MHNFADDIYNTKAKQARNMVRTRLIVIGCLFVLAFLTVGAKAVENCLFASEWKKTKSYKPVEKSTRTEIIDRNGVILATNLKTASVYANPREILDIEEASFKLSEALPDVDATSLLAEFSQKSSFVWIKRNLTPKEQKAINNLGIPGIYFTEDISRVYPNGSLLSHALGYVSVDNQGLAGVERKFNDELSSGRTTPLQLSIDVKLQHILREELLNQAAKFHAKGATGLVADVKTGEILAMVSLPDYDPNQAGYATKDQKFNRVTLGTYEMGSSFKSLTAAIALDLGVANLNSTYDATQSLKVGRQTIHDYHAKKRILTLPEVMMFSSNIGTARLAMSVGTEKLKEGLAKLGMFDKVDLEISERALPQYPRRWSEIVTMTVSFGHGIAVSAAHMAQAYIPIVNGGFRIPLTLLKKNKGDEIASTKVFSSKTSQDMRTILRDIVKGGTGKNADAEGYLVGGKTGTAEKIEHGHYSKTGVMSSFAAAFPINDPKYFVLAIVDEPREIVKGVRPTGGIVAAPIVKNFVGRAGPLLGIKPQYEVTPKKNEIYVEKENAAIIRTARN